MTPGGNSEVYETVENFYGEVEELLQSSQTELTDILSSQKNDFSTIYDRYLNPEIDMTVKCLTEVEKEDLAYSYELGMSIKDLAINYGVSARTVGRVLEEHNLASPVPRIQAEAQRVMKMLTKYHVTEYELERILEQYKAPTKAYDRKQAALLQPKQSQATNQNYYTAGNA